ncbi:Hypothetical predicted protein [Mytilus galloprovincialis]|uniref:EGF-like domain-containing protein n=1 Tax=Mytilus galloprovincialis TaxID=29158 RepID=A0A8B6GV64_MYTGA|nr:Hypothetical predicted protein [Mytilus galloprovincialis]
MVEEHTLATPYKIQEQTNKKHMEIVFEYFTGDINYVSWTCMDVSANFQCFNGGKHVTRSNGHVVCECIGNWTGNFCQGSEKVTKNAYKYVRMNMAMDT